MRSSTSLVIVSYNKRPYTALCLESLLKGEPRPDEIIVVDNGSTDGSVSYLQEVYPALAKTAGVRFQLLCNDRNVGACTARNQGLKHVSGRYVGFLDNDTAIRTKAWLAILSNTLESERDAGIVGPKLVFPFPPYNIEHAGAAISPNGRPMYLGRGCDRLDPAYAQRREVQCLISAAWLVKREVIETIGDFDEVFNPAQFEDFDFCYRARQRGFRVYYEPAAELYHFENVTTDGSADVNFRYITIKNGRIFKQRWKHVFSQEAGPPDEMCVWHPLPTQTIEETGIPPIV
ncbi:MAG: glycosyltransferase family 2 protein [Candidatus Zipacnadales bacterium]